MVGTRTYRRGAAGVAALVLACLAGCGTETGGSSAGTGSRAVPEGYVPAGYTGAFRGSGTVLQDGTHGPQLCGAVMDSLPPQCSGLDLVGWDWDAVEHREEVGVRWVDAATVTGTLQGTTLTLTAPPVPGAAGQQTPLAQDFSTPCPEPEGGWRPVDPARATEEARGAALELARASADYAGGWIDQSYLPDGAPPEQANDPQRYVLDLLFTGDLAAHEAAVREVWGGALCVTEAERPYADLQRVQEELTRPRGGAGPTLSSTAVSETENRVEAVADVAWWADQQALDERYGVGTVHLSGWLVPVG